MTTPTQTSRRRWTIALGAMALTLTLSFAFSSSGSATAPQDEDAIGTARAILEKYRETETQISKAASAWREGKQTLENEIELIEQQIESRNETIGSTSKKIDGLVESTMKLEAEKANLEAASGELEAIVAELEAEVLRLVARLPEKFQTDVERFSSLIPKPGTETELSLGRRYAFLVGVLTNVVKFNRTIELVTELREMGEGKPSIEVSTLYLGLGQAYYANTKGTVGGFGRAEDDAWVWTESNENAAKIAQVIKVFNKSEPASFIQLPITIK